jgi:hypothetical protein
VNGERESHWAQSRAYTNFGAPAVELEIVVVDTVVVLVTVGSKMVCKSVTVVDPVVDVKYSVWVTEVVLVSVTVGVTVGGKFG